MKSASSHAAVLGGGVIGLALARELAAHKWRVTVVDPQPPAMEASFARKVGVSVTTLATCHLSILEQPEKVAAVIRVAAKASSRKAAAPK